MILPGSTIAFRIVCVARLLRAARIPSLFDCSNPLVSTRSIRSAVRLLSCAVWGNLFAATVWMLLNGKDLVAEGHTESFTLLTGLYWAIQTSTSVGYGDILPPEWDWSYRILNCVTMLIGVASYSYFTGYLSVSVIQRDAVQIAIADKKAKMNSMMTFFGVPWEIQKQAFSLYPRLVESANVDYQDVLRVLPPFMQEQIGFYVRIKLISRVPMFQEAEPEILQFLSEQLEEEIVAPRQFVMRQGDIGREMFFLAHGVVEVIDTNEKTREESLLTLLKDGSWFGELAILKDATRTASVRTVTCCDLMVLSQDSILQILEEHTDSDFARTIQREADTRWSLLPIERRNSSSLRKNSRESPGPSSGSTPPNSAAAVGNRQGSATHDFFEMSNSVGKEIAATSVSNIPLTTSLNIPDNAGGGLPRESEVAPPTASSMSFPPPMAKQQQQHPLLPPTDSMASHEQPPADDNTNNNDFRLELPPLMMHTNSPSASLVGSMGNPCAVEMRELQRTLENIEKAEKAEARRWGRNTPPSPSGVNSKDDDEEVTLDFE